MKTLLVALGLFTLGACSDRGRETGRVGESVDTTVQNRTTQDTTIVSSDTTVQTDTIRKEGEVKRDTAKQ